MLIMCPNNSDECVLIIEPHPKIGFLMISNEENNGEIRRKLNEIFEFNDFQLIDAMNIRDSTDNYCKICKLILSCPFGVALITQNTNPGARSNIYLEMGLMRAFGKQVLILTDNRDEIASDLVGKGIERFSNYEEMQKKVNEWLEFQLKQREYYKNLGKIWLKEKDYEKAYAYYQKAIMLGDFEDSLWDLIENFGSTQKKSPFVPKRLRTEITRFIGNIEAYRNHGKTSDGASDEISNPERGPLGVPITTKNDVPSVSLKISDLPGGWVSETKILVGDYWEYGSSFRNRPKRSKVPTLKSVIYYYDSAEEARREFENNRQKAASSARDNRLFIPDIGEECYGYISGHPLAVVIFRTGNLLVRTEYECDPADPSTEEAEQYAKIVDKRIQDFWRNTLSTHKPG